MRHQSKNKRLSCSTKTPPPSRRQPFVPTDEQRASHRARPRSDAGGRRRGHRQDHGADAAHCAPTEEGHAKPNEILAITYTRELGARSGRAAGGSLAGRKDRAVRASGATIRALRSEPFTLTAIDLLCDAGRRFELIDDQDLYVLLRRNIEELGLEHFITAGNLGKFLNDLLDFFRRCSDELRGPDDYDRYVADLVAGKEKPPRVCSSKQTLSDDDAIARCREIARVFRRVEQKLAAAGMGTYGDVITRALALLDDEHNPQWLHRARDGARFMLIDEFQDSNVAQIRLTKRLAGEEANVFAVGDPDQAIYRFRGATSGAFDQFLAAFGADV